MQRRSTMPATAPVLPPDQGTATTIVRSRRKPASDQAKMPITQERNPNRRARWPEWLRQMPRMNFPPPNESFQLIDPNRLNELLSSVDSATRQSIMNDMDF